MVQRRYGLVPDSPICWGQVEARDVAASRVELGEAALFCNLASLIEDDDMVGVGKLLLEELVRITVVAWRRNRPSRPRRL